MTRPGHVIVALDARPTHEYVDWVAVTNALAGRTQDAMRLSRTECLAAVVEGRRLGIGSPTLAVLLCMHEREVQRLQAEVRATASRGRP